MQHQLTWDQTLNLMRGGGAPGVSALLQQSEHALLLQPVRRSSVAPSSMWLRVVLATFLGTMDKRSNIDHASVLEVAVD